MFTVIIYILIGLIGVIMGTLYKRSISSISGLKFEPKKVRKLYWRFAFLMIVLYAFLCYQAIKSFHQDVPLAEDKMHRFQDYELMLIYFLNIGFMVMIILSNVYSMSAQNVRIPMYVFTFLIYAAFVVLDNFMLEDALFQFKKINLLWQGDFNLAYIKGYLSLLFCAGLCAFNAFMTHRGIKDKTQAPVR